jgi:hypothetical protein
MLCGLAAVALGCLALAGCGGTTTPPTLDGKVTYKGAPLTGGKLLLYSATPGAPVVQRLPGTNLTMPAAHVLFIRPDGSFQGTAPPPGQYRIAIDNSHLALQTEGLPPDYAKKVVSATESALGKHISLPERYSDPARSGLSVSIEDGVNHQDVALL